MINKLVIQGRLVRDVELKKTQSGVDYAEFTVAWSEKIKEIENKCFIRCKSWGHTATFVDKYFCKGQELLIEGQMRTEEWEKDGQKQSRVICNIDKVHFCGTKTEPKQTHTSTDWGATSFNIGDDDFPFN